MTDDGPLARLVRELILAEGPIGLDRYMALALGHPLHGYYMNRDPFGAAGDFTTAPEISQMFGEMIGLWAASVFLAMGAPPRIALVELGPGRGTLMADALRAARIVPAFAAAADVHLVETSRRLRERQRAALAGSGAQLLWHDTIDTLPDGPTLVIANEFVDALPVRHYQRTARGWCERLIGVDADGRFAFGLSAAPDERLTIDAPPGALLELGIAAQALIGRLATRLVRDGGAALVIDYGHVTPSFGETLQAVRRHGFADPLVAPGEADLTAHVDFAALVRVARAAGAAVHGPVTQGPFLLDLGIVARADLLGRARPDQAADLADALHRLTGDDPGMGQLFKVLAVTAPEMAPPPGFSQIEPASTM